MTLICYWPMKVSGSVDPPSLDVVALMEKSLRDLKLTNDELDRLGKAFKDPQFCKLFAEYAEELNDPENKRRFVVDFA